MAHLHNIYDSDIHFKLDSKTRTFSNETELKLLVAQGDHNSEIFTFEIPRYIEQHDMLKCNRIEIHYINISSTTRDTSKDVYIVDDAQVSPEDENVVEFSWLLSGHATQYNGTLSFAVSMKCLTDEVIDYRWNTLTYDKILVGKSLNNAETIAQEYSDVLEKWKKEVLENVNPTVTIDTELNEESDNAIANCTVAKKISQLSDSIDDLKENGTDVTGTTDYAQLENKPSINGVSLVGNKTSDDLGIGNPTDEQVASSVETWLNAHPEATTTVQDGSVTKEKLAIPVFEGELSSNLVNPNTISVGRFTNANGGVQSFAEGNAYYDFWRMTDYINVSEHIGETISCTNYQGYCFYDENKTAITGSCVFFSSINYGEGNYGTQFTIPEGAYYVRIAYWYTGDAIHSYQANYGETLDLYSEYGSVGLPNNIIRNKHLGEPIEIANIENEKIALLNMPNNLVNLDDLYVDCNIDKNTGNMISVDSAYQYTLTGFIEVKEKTNYLGRWASIYFYDEDKQYLSYTNNITIITPTKCKYVRVLIAGIHHYKIAKQSMFGLFEGTTTPKIISSNKPYLEIDKLEQFGIYQSVINRMSDLFNPFIKTSIGIYGDSNTAGLETGNTGVYLENCWANLVCNQIKAKYDKDVEVSVFSKDITSFGGNYEKTINLNKSTDLIYCKFYGAVCKVNCQNVSKGVISIQIDGNEVGQLDTNTATQYVAQGLTEEEHELKITWVSGQPQVVSITVHKYVVVENKGESGINTTKLPFDDTTYDIYITVFGTNNRGTNDVSLMKNNYEHFINTQYNRGSKVIPIVPTPATDGFETGASSGLKMEDIEAGILSVCGTFNLEPINLYSYILDYCDFTGTDLNSTLRDTLHITEATHKIVYKYLCSVLGLGRPIDDYLPTTE